jgi:phenylacetate-coenzyme A ligase PaaK-like adenylate-forming protein
MSTQIILKVSALRHRLRQRDRLTRRQLKEHQVRALGRLREHAYARSPFYERFHRGLADRALDDLPILHTSMEIVLCCSNKAWLEPVEVVS